MTDTDGKIGQVAAGRLRQLWSSSKVAWDWARAHAVTIGFALLCVCAALWLLEHNARLKREVELKHLRRETAAEVAALRARAESAMKEHRENAKVIRDLESRRASLESEAAQLRHRLNFLREEEQLRVRQASTAGHVELSAQDASPAGPKDLGSRESEEAEIRNSKVTTPDSRSPTPALDACREQSAVRDQLISNCEERVGASQAVIDALNRSVANLEETIRDKDQIAARLDAAHRAELRAARGSRLGRFGRAMKYVGVGVVIGIALAH